MSYAMCAFVFLKKSKMLEAGQKCNSVHKTLQEKAGALKDIGKGLLNMRLLESIMYQIIPHLHGSKIKTKSSHHSKKEKM